MSENVGKSRVLCVDDEADFLEWLENFLGAHGFLVSSTTKPNEALNLLQRDYPIDLIICDLRMPEVNGLELIQQIRQSSAVPVILLTGFGDYDSLRDALRLGVYDFFEKPFKAEIFLTALQRAARIGQVINTEEWSNSLNLSIAREALRTMKLENQQLKEELARIRKKRAA